MQEQLSDGKDTISQARHKQLVTFLIFFLMHHVGWRGTSSQLKTSELAQIVYGASWRHHNTFLSRVPSLIGSCLLPYRVVLECQQISRPPLRLSNVTLAEACENQIAVSLLFVLNHKMTEGQSTITFDMHQPYLCWIIDKHLLPGTYAIFINIFQIRLK